MSRFGPDVALIDPAYIDTTAQIYGKVTIEHGSSLWPNSVIRSEVHEVRIGKFTNIQDFVMIHIGYGTPVHIGDYCSITHHCTLHGCTIGDNCLIGINATIMDNCVIGDNCVIASHTYLKDNTIIPDNSIVMGLPGKVIRAHNSFVENRQNAMLYYRNALAYAKGDHRTWENLADFDKESQSINEAFEARYGARAGE